MSDDCESDPTTPFELAADRRISSLEHSRKFWRWVAPTLASAGLALAAWGFSTMSAAAERAGRDGAQIDSLRRSIDTLDLDVRELRAKILKLSATTPDNAVVIAVVP
jgi:hypothetical protein